MTTTRAGFVAIAGRPNAGKSTLLNRLVGERLAITSPKPQSTRERVAGIITDADTQIVLLDTPGLLAPEHALHAAMRSTAVRALSDADLVLHLHDVTGGPPPPLADLAGIPAASLSAPVLLVLNKSDELGTAARERFGREYPDAVLVSARTGAQVETLLERIRSVLPPGPFLYPGDDLSTQPLRFFAAEMVREAALEQLDEEVPHCVACVIEEFRESPAPVYIRAMVYVERESQKRILIGAGGRTVKAIGSSARAKIEPLVGGQVFLDLRVKVLRNWRRDTAALRRLGFQVPEDSRR